MRASPTGTDGAFTAWTLQTDSRLMLAAELQAEGTYALQIQAQYPQTYWSGSFSHSFTIDRTVPEVILTSAILTN